MISICCADGEARDIVNQANQSPCVTGALTPEDDYYDKSQVDMCPLPFTIWFEGTARVCLLLACACCIYVQHSGQPTYFSIQAAIQRVPMSSTVHWCMMLSVKCLKWRATNQMTAFLSGKQFVKATAL